MAFIGTFSRALLDSATAVYFGGVSVSILDAQGSVILGDNLPDAPTITSTIADRVYATGDGAVTVDLRTKFDAATSYTVSPTNPAVSISDYTLTISPTAALTQTTFTVRGINGGGASEPLTFNLTVNAPSPVLLKPFADQSLLIGGGTVVLPLAEYFSGAVGYAVSPSGEGVNISNGNLVISRSTARDVIVTVTATNATGQDTSDSFALLIGAPVNQAPVASAIPEQRPVANVPFTVDLSGYFEDPNGDPLIFDYTGILPTGITRTGAVFSGTAPVTGQTANGVLRARDPGNLEAEAPVPWLVAVQPAITAEPITLTAGQQATIRFNTTVDTVTVAQGNTTLTAARVGNTNDWTFTPATTEPVAIGATKAGWKEYSATITPAPAPASFARTGDNRMVLRDVTEATPAITYTSITPDEYDGTYTVPALSVLSSGPAPVVPPRLIGTPAVGETLTLLLGTVASLSAQEPAASWEWPDGGTDSTFVVRPEDQGTSISVEVALTDQQGTREVTTNVMTVAAQSAMTGKLWVGHYDDTSVTVTASDVQGTDNVRLAATPVSGGATIQTAALSVDATYRFVKGTITGLAPGVKYTIRLQSTAGQAIGDAGAVTTRPATRQAFKVGFASCHRSNSGENAIFDTILDQNPGLAAFYHLGDRGYPDIGTNEVARFHANDDAVMAGSKVARLHRSVPVLYMWDDHDFGSNNATGSSASRPAALAWFRARVPARPYSSVASDSCLHIHSPMPGVTFVMLDPRSGRAGGQIITPADEAILIAQIQATGATANGILVFNAGVPWVSASDNDTWHGASQQRARIAEAITQYAPGRVAIKAGDMHALAFDSGVNSVGGVPVFHAAPLAQSGSTKGGPYSSGTPVTATGNQYGLLEFAPITGGWALTFRGYSVDAAGAQTQRLTHTVNLVRPADQAPLFTGTSSISGGSVVGDVLTAEPGPVSGSPTPTLTYQWRMDDVNVSGATGQTFVRPSTVGGVPSVIITLTNGVGTAATRTLTAAATTAAGTATGVPDSPIAAMSDINGQTFQSGEQWTKLGGTGQIPTSRVSQLPGGFAFSPSGVAYYRRGPVDRGPNQYMKAGRWVKDNTSNAVSLCLMMSGDGTTRHELRIGNSELQIRTYIAGVFTTHQTISTASIPTATVCSIEFALIGDVLRAWVNGTVVGEHTLAAQHVLTGGGTGLASKDARLTNVMIDIEARNTR